MNNVKRIGDHDNIWQKYHNKKCNTSDNHYHLQNQLMNPH